MTKTVEGVELEFTHDGSTSPPTSAIENIEKWFLDTMESARSLGVLYTINLVFPDTIGLLGKYNTFQDTRKALQDAEDREIESLKGIRTMSFLQELLNKIEQKILRLRLERIESQLKDLCIKAIENAVKAGVLKRKVNQTEYELQSGFEAQELLAQFRYGHERYWMRQL